MNGEIKNGEKNITALYKYNNILQNNFNLINIPLCQAFWVALVSADDVDTWVLVSSGLVCIISE